jgi:hypothetical protein
VNVLGCRTATRSFLSMCRSVVFPALSRPRKSSFACLFARPSEASRSKTKRVYQRRVPCEGIVMPIDGERAVADTYTCFAVSGHLIPSMQASYQLTIHMSISS